MGTFISYSRSNSKFVVQLYSDLKDAGFDIWLDQVDIRKGSRWDDEIEKALQECANVLIVLTPTSIQSQNVKDEIGYAIDGGKQILPILLQPCNIPLRLRRFQFVDFTNKTYEDGLTEIRHLLGSDVFTQLCSVPDKATGGTIGEGTLPDKRSGSKTIFICYKRYSTPDRDLLEYLSNRLRQKGHVVFTDTTLRTGENWLEKIDDEIKRSDFLITLLSNDSANSEMVQAEIRRAYDYGKLQGHPQILPVRIAYEGLLPYSIEAFLNPLQYVVWNSEEDSEQLAQEILDAIQGQLPKKKPITIDVKNTGLSEDGRFVSVSTSDLQPPLPVFDPRFIDELDTPGGTVKLSDRFYIERECDHRLNAKIIYPGQTITIRAARQTGKSSLLLRGVNSARQKGMQSVHFDATRLDATRLTDIETFLLYFAEFILRKLHLDISVVGKYWEGRLSPQEKISYLLEDYVLTEIEPAVVLSMDEIDRLLDGNFFGEFFGLVRSWHNARANNEIWNKLSIVMVISTEPYLLIQDTTQSPFNVGMNIYLEDFSVSQVQELNHRYGMPVSSADFPSFYSMFSGHPFLTRKALYTMVVDNKSWEELALISASEQGPFADHLRHYLWMIKKQPALQDALRQVIQKQECQNEEMVYRLLQAGLVKASGNVVKCRCELYRYYFGGKL